MHLCHAMLRPKTEAIERVREFIKKASVDFGPARVERQGKAAVVTVNNPRFLNAEDDDTLDDTETAADIAHPRSDERDLRACAAAWSIIRNTKAARFSPPASISRISIAGRFPTSGTSAATWAWSTRCCAGWRMGGASPDEVYGGTREKPWIAGLDVFAIGGGCQYLLAMDYVVAG